MALSQTVLHNAHDFTVIDSQFISIANTNISNVSDNDPVSTTLWQQVAAGAMFDSAERFPPAKCHPGTRERMIEKIVDWIDNPTPNQRILWLYGPAGSGKSALAHTICERYKDRCKGSFFFAKGLTDRGKALKLFATLSYQLALQFPSMRAALNEALHRDPSLPTKSMEAQLFSLIIQPLLRTPLPEHSPILIIDGLDECADDQGMDTQGSIITLISKSIVEYNLPLRFLIASRPESWIRDTFESSPLPSITLSLSLRDDIDADKDIRAYLTDGFEKIRMENKRIMGSVALPWPPTHIVERFVYEASGQYIYASTVLKFVGNSSKHNDPEEQLRILISPSPHRALAFSELDRLYVTIVSAYPRWATMKRVLGGILVHANSTIIEKILGVEPREFILVMDALSPLIDVMVPPPLSYYAQLLEPIYGSLTAGRDEIRLCHLSLREFLEDKSRSGAFHIDVQQIFQEITMSIFGIIIGNIAQNYTTEPNITFNIGLATYWNMMSNMVYGCMDHKHLSDTQLLDLEPFHQLIIAMTQSLLLLEPDLEVDHFGCFMADMELLHSILLKISNSPIQQEKVTDFIHAISELKQATSHARKRWIHILTSAKRFRVTPTLAYLYQFHSDVLGPIDKIFNLGHPVMDVLSSLRQHRHIITISHPAMPWHLSVVHLSEDLDDRDEVYEGWRTQGEWRHQRISIMSQQLNVTFDPSYDIDDWGWAHFEYLGKFFMSRNLTDIQTSKYFQNPCNLSILSMLTNFLVPTSWANPQAQEWHQIARLIVPVLCWFNRQLTNSTTLELLESHDRNLVPKMKTTMKQIFERYYLPNHARSYRSELSLTTVGFDTRSMSIKMKVLPLPQGYNQEEIPLVMHDDLYPFYWRGFHDEILGKSFRTQLGPRTSDGLLWHPYLASYLLNSLAKDLYTEIDPDFQRPDRPEEQSKESFTYIVECLPYAETTQQNLDSLRAIAYFFPQVNLEWDPPIEFWYLSVEFLRKYDRSILSEDELNHFEWWMYSMGRYMKRYHPVAQGPSLS